MCLCMCVCEREGERWDTYNNNNVKFEREINSSKKKLNNKRTREENIQVCKQQQQTMVKRERGQIMVLKFEKILRQILIMGFQKMTTITGM